MITLSLSRTDAALLYRRLEDDRRLVNLKLAELASNLPDAIYAFRTEQKREELAHLDRVLAAIRAAQAAQEVIYYDETHKETYNALCAQMRYLDAYHRALAYLLALDAVVREHVADVYDCNEDCIKPDGLLRPWQTGTSIATTRLAFNLWSGFAADDEGDNADARNYTPEQIFSRREYAPYYWQAIRLRFEIQ